MKVEFEPRSESYRVWVSNINEDNFMKLISSPAFDPYKFLKNYATSELCGEGVIKINHEGFFYKGTRYGEPFEFKIPYNLLPTLGMVTDVSFFALYYDGKYYDIFPERRSVGKILLLVEEMHRLHVNTWKNFPWADTYN
jgi:hypothetical protein